MKAILPLVALATLTAASTAIADSNLSSCVIRKTPTYACDVVDYEATALKELPPVRASDDPDAVQRRCIIKWQVINPNGQVVPMSEVHTVSYYPPKNGMCSAEASKGYIQIGFDLATSLQKRVAQLNAESCDEGRFEKAVTQWSQKKLPAEPQANHDSEPSSGNASTGAAAK